MKNQPVNLPGYKGVDANFVSAILDEVHDIAQELAFIQETNLRGMDRMNRSYVEAAFSHAIRRAHNELVDIMLHIRNMRTPTNPQDKTPYRVLASRYVRTADTKE